MPFTSWNSELRRRRNEAAAIPVPGCNLVRLCPDKAAAALRNDFILAEKLRVKWLVVVAQSDTSIPGSPPEAEGIKSPGNPWA